MRELRFLALNGFLGYGYDVESFKNGMALNPDIIGVDAGSTDPGAYYLGSGAQLTKKSQVYNDISQALPEAVKRKIPFIIGTAGTSGGEPHIQSLLEVIYECAEKNDLHFKMAVIRSEVDKAIVKKALEEGRLEGTRGVPPVTSETIDQTSRIVGQMGTEPFMRALEAGADVIVAGRACDTAIYGGAAILNGYKPGLAFHMAKILECGALCAVPAAANDCLMGIIREDHFVIKTLSDDRIVTPESVAAHTLYEQAHPMELVEPEGIVSLHDSEYLQLDKHSVKVSGSVLLPNEEETIKLEGARFRGFRTITIGGIRDPEIISNLESIEKTVREKVDRHSKASLDNPDYYLSFRYYGKNAVLGKNESQQEKMVHEIGVVIEVVAETEKDSTDLLSLARSNFLHCHFEGRKTTAGNLAFPFSPSDISCGEVYDFSLYHVLKGESSEKLFPIEYRIL